MVVPGVDSWYATATRLAYHRYGLSGTNEIVPSAMVNAMTPQKYIVSVVTKLPKSKFLQHGLRGYLVASSKEGIVVCLLLLRIVHDETRQWGTATSMVARGSDNVEDASSEAPMGFTGIVHLLR